LLPITSATRFSACAGCPIASNVVAMLTANAALTDSQLFIECPAFPISIASLAIFGSSAPPVQPIAVTNVANFRSAPPSERASSLHLCKKH
jgi:hypothetical protein